MKNFKTLEKKWQEKWSNQDWFKAVDNDKSREKKYVLVEFPYPSGEGLHVGHAFTMTGADAYARKKRMDGFNVLFPMGWDAFGLPAENYAIKKGIHPQKAVEENVNNFRRQMKEMAFSFDWEREVNTTDPDYYHWTQWIFVQLFKKGLAYKEEKPINWCPSCKIGLANEEVVDGKCERCGAEATKKNLSQWIVKITDYADQLIDGLKETAFITKVKAAQINWIDRKQWIDITYPIEGRDDSIVVSTTRPDTNFGATFIVLAPEHPFFDNQENIPEEYREKVYEYIKNSKKKSERERLVQNREKTGQFTGIHCLNRLTNKKMPVYVTDFVLASVGTGAVVGVPGHDTRDFQFAQKFDLPVVRVVAWNDDEDSQIDSLEKVREDLDGGKMVNSDFLNGLTPAQALVKIMDYLEEKGWGKRTIRYHLRDWIFSRQHYWGEPIPMVNCQKCGWQSVKEEDLPIVLPDVEKYQPTETGESPLAAMVDWVETTCPKCGGPAKRETDTMPNWAGSDWYFLRYLDRDNQKAIASMKKMKYWMPVDIYIGGDEHNTLHLLYSRFIYQFLRDIKVVPEDIPEPYYKRLSHGVILGPDGQRMSKSKGNIIVPDEVCRKYGVDAVRTYMMFIGPFEATMAWNEDALKGVTRFLSRFNDFVAKQKDSQGKEAPSLRTGLNKLIKKVGEDLDSCQFNTAVAALMEFLNQAEKEDWQLNRVELKKLIQLLAPFAPYLTEELWEGLGEQESIHASKWPEYQEEYLTAEKVEIPVQVNGRVREVVEVDQEASEDQEKVVKVAQEIGKVSGYLKGKEVVKIIFVPKKLVNFVIK